MEISPCRARWRTLTIEQLYELGGARWRSLTIEELNEVGVARCGSLTIEELIEVGRRAARTPTCSLALIAGAPASPPRPELPRERQAQVRRSRACTEVFPVNATSASSSGEPSPVTPNSDHERTHGVFPATTRAAALPASATRSAVRGVATTSERTWRLPALGSGGDARARQLVCASVISLQHHPLASREGDSSNDWRPQILAGAVISRRRSCRSRGASGPTPSHAPSD